MGPRGLYSSVCRRVRHGADKFTITANSYKGDDKVWPEYIKERVAMEGVCQKHFFKEMTLISFRGYQFTDTQPSLPL